MIEEEEESLASWAREAWAQAGSDYGDWAFALHYPGRQRHECCHLMGWLPIRCETQDLDPPINGLVNQPPTDATRVDAMVSSLLGRTVSTTVSTPSSPPRVVVGGELGGAGLASVEVEVGGSRQIPIDPGA